MEKALISSEIPPKKTRKSHSPVVVATALVLAIEPVIEEDPDMVDDVVDMDDIMLDAILDPETLVLAGAAAPPVAPLLLLLAVEVDEEAQEADVGKVTPSLSGEQVSSC